jgi:predicted DNA binding CopG/RHH family protein
MKTIPKFTNEKEESEFWDTHDLADYLDETTPMDVTFVDARPPKTQISLRLDPETIAKLKALARRKGIGYQTLIRIWLLERLGQERGS